MRMSLIGIIIILGAALAGPWPAPAHAAVSAPVLKWAYGGCFASWCQTGWYASPAVADLDGDTQPEVVWGSYDLVALNGADGSVQWRAPNGNRVWPSPAIADLTGNGSLEIVVGRSGDQLTVYDAAGTVLWTRNPFGLGEIRTLAVADLEGDTQLEIVVGRAGSGGTRQLSVYSPAGAVRPGWPARRDGDPGNGWGMYNQNVAVADLNGDGLHELYGPTDTHYVTALDRDGNQLPASPVYGAGKVWSQVGVHVDHAVDLRTYASCGREHRPNFADSAPAAGDLDADGILELVVVGNVYNCGTSPYTSLYRMPFLFNSDRTRWSGSGFDWTAIPGPLPGGGPLSENYAVIESSVANAVLADLDGDGLKEILFPSYDGRLHAYWLDKRQHGAWPFDIPGAGIQFASEPAVVDLDNDGRAEVLVASWPQKGSRLNGQLFILDADGNLLHAVDLPAPRSTGATWNGGLGAPTVANIDTDADLEVVLGTAAAGVVAYELPGSAAASCRWCTGRGSLRRTGVAPIQNDFAIRPGTVLRTIEPGQPAGIPVSLQAGPASGPGVTLSVNSSPAGLATSLADPTIDPPGAVTLTVTDTRPPGSPGRWYAVRVTATGGGFTRFTDIQVLSGGQQLMLPSIQR